MAVTVTVTYGIYLVGEEPTSGANFTRNACESFWKKEKKILKLKFKT